MYLTEYDVRSIAASTRIELAEEEVPALTADINSIIDSLKPIVDHTFDGVEPTYYPIAGLANAVRADEIKPCLPRETALALAAETEDGRYRIPPILSESGG